MYKVVRSSCALLVLLFVTISCSQGQAPGQPFIPTRTVSGALLPTPLPLATLPNNTPVLSNPASPEANATAPVNPSETVTPLATTTAPPPTPVIPDGLYITDLRFSPDPPVRGAELNFFATFANATNAELTFRWIVYIYRSDNPAKSYSETTVTTSILSLGAQEQKSNGYWKLPVGGPCEDYVARVAFIDNNNKASLFKQPNGQTFEKPFALCAPSDLPTNTPAEPTTPTAVPTPGAGLFISSMRTDPYPPTRGSNLNFYATFVNTTNAIQNYRWVVFIYRSDNPAKSYGQTTVTQVSVPVGTAEGKSDGFWKLPLGGPCEDYVARPYYLDAGNHNIPFARPDGQVFEFKMTVCPP